MNPTSDWFRLLTISWLIDFVANKLQPMHSLVEHLCSFAIALQTTNRFLPLHSDSAWRTGPRLLLPGLTALSSLCGPPWPHATSLRQREPLLGPTHLSCAQRSSTRASGLLSDGFRAGGIAYGSHCWFDTVASKLGQRLRQPRPQVMHRRESRSLSGESRESDNKNVSKKIHYHSLSL